MTHRNRVNGLAAAIFYWMTVSNLEFGVLSNSIPDTLTIRLLTVRPRPQDESSPDALISYKASDQSSYNPWISALEDHLRGYEKRPRGNGSNVVECDFHRPPPPNKCCDVNVTTWGHCTSKNTFGWLKPEPCIFLEMLPLPGWIPEFFNDTQSLPDEMPEDLKSYIKNSNLDPASRNTVWVSCDGVYDEDKELIGPIEFIPRPGFPGYYFYNNQVDGWLNPIVALHLRRPARGIIINIKCKAWTREVVLEYQFALMIED